MRFDEINLNGQFAVNGITGAPGQYLGLSGGSLYWINSKPSTGGFDTYGSNFVYCNSTYSATASAENLINSYASASNFSVDSQNRALILLGPGIYDFDIEPFGLSLSYVDIVGISPNPDSVILKSTTAPHILKYYQGVDSGLYNVSIQPQASQLGILGSSSTYLRWKNIKVFGESFYTTAPYYSFENLVGEFRNIDLGYDANFAIASNTIDGVFENITSTYLSRFAIAPNGVKGTFSNLKLISDNADFFQADSGNIEGQFKKIFINAGNKIFYGSGIYGSYEDIVIKKVILDAFFGHKENATFKNIDLRGSEINKVFSGNNSGIFDNIKIGTSINPCFDSGTGSIIGTFSNIEILEAVDAFVSTGGDIVGEFENINVNKLTNLKFFTCDGLLSGKFRNIKLGDSDMATILDCFSTNSDQLLNLDIDNLKIGGYVNITNPSKIFSGGTISGNYKNISIGTFSSTGQLFYSKSGFVGNFENIILPNSDQSFVKYIPGGQGGIVGNFKNIRIGDNNNCFMTYGEGDIKGIFQDIKVGNIYGYFFSSGANGIGDIIGTFSNIETGDVFYPFLCQGNDMISDFKNINLSGTTKDSFYTSQNFNCNFSNINIGTLGGDGFGCGSDMYLYLDNLKINGLTNDNVNLFYPTELLVATVSNVYIKASPSVYRFIFASKLMVGTYRNINVGPDACGRFFQSIDYSATMSIENSSLAGCIGTMRYNGDLPNRAYTGRISNTLISCGSYENPAICVGTGSIIYRCRFNSGFNLTVEAVNTSTCRISYTTTNNGYSANITNVIVDNKNIDNINVKAKLKM